MMFLIYQKTVKFLFNLELYEMKSNYLDNQNDVSDKSKDSKIFI